MMTLFQLRMNIFKKIFNQNSISKKDFAKISKRLVNLSLIVLIYSLIDYFS